jgi:predicted RNA-binding Zn-ribbon protein involved in translation (DUF1610 family)
MIIKDNSSRNVTRLRFVPPRPYRAPPIAQVVRRGRQLVILKCPFCGRRHYHGDANKTGPDFGHRLAHCHKPWRPNDAGYLLFECPPCSEQQPAAPKERGRRARGNPT